MKKIVQVSLLFIFIFSHAYGQKHDYIWLSGNSTHSTKLMLDFNESPLNKKQAPIYGIGIKNDIAVLSDSFGQLLAISNGRSIYQSDGSVMDGGDSINLGFLWHYWHQGNDAVGYYNQFRHFFLPFPGHKDHYILVHNRVIRDSFGNFMPDLLQYSILDMSAHGGNGKVIQTDIPLSQGRIIWPVATKHGNGRDWWIITGEAESTIHHIYLLSEKGVTGPFLQDIGPAWTDYEGTDQCSFSPDGKIYIRHDGISGLRIYDFDRCTGELSNLRIMPYRFGFWSESLAFSPDSRFLYLGDRFHVYQIDISLSDPSSRIDTLHDIGISKSIHWASVAPTNEVFFHPYYPGGIRFREIVHSPTLPGIACDLEPDFFMSNDNNYGMPVFPYYRLGEWEGAPCDTVNLQLPDDGFYKSRYIHMEIQSDESVNSFRYLSPINGDNSSESHISRLENRFPLNQSIKIWENFLTTNKQ